MKLLKTNKEFLPILLILISSFFTLLPLIHGGILHYGVDMSFHLNRAYELAENLKHGALFPYIYTYSFNQVGMPLGMVYGAAPLYPIALSLIVFKNPIFAVYLGIWSIIFAGMLLNYWIGLKYWEHNRKKALLFSFLYVISNYVFNLFFGSFDLGQSGSLVFLPLIAYGAYSIFFKNHHEWYLLTLGMTGVIYTHILSTLMYSVLVMIITILGLVFADHKLKRFLSLIYAVILTLGTTLFSWISLFQTFSHNQLTVTKPSSISSAGQGVGDFLIKVLNSNSSFALGIVTLVAAFAGFLTWKKHSVRVKVTGILGMTFCLVTTNEFNFAWYFLNKTPLTALQWPGRFYCIAFFLLSVFAVDSISILFANSKHKKLCYGFLLLCILFVSLSNTYTFIDDSKNQQPINFVPSKIKPLPSSNYKIVNKPGFTYVTSKYNTGVGSIDYWPTKSLPSSYDIRDHIALVGNDNKRVKVNPASIPNGIQYNVSSTKPHSRIDLPFLYYFDYLVTTNGKRVKGLRSSRSTMLLDLQKGNNKIQIKYIPSTKIKISKYVSFFAIITLILMMFFSHLRNEKALTELKISKQ